MFLTAQSAGLLTRQRVEAARFELVPAQMQGRPDATEAVDQLPAPVGSAHDDRIELAIEAKALLERADVIVVVMHGERLVVEVELRDSDLFDYHSAIDQQLFDRKHGRLPSFESTVRAALSICSGCTRPTRTLANRSSALR